MIKSMTLWIWESMHVMRQFTIYDEWVAVRAPLLQAGAGVFGDGGRRSTLARLLHLCEGMGALSGHRLPRRWWRTVHAGLHFAAEMADVLGRPFTRHRRLVVSPRKSSAVSTLWTSLLVQIAAIDDPRTWCGGCNFQFFKSPICTRVGLYCSLV